MLVHRIGYVFVLCCLCVCILNRLCRLATHSYVPTSFVGANRPVFTMYTVHYALYTPYSLHEGQPWSAKHFVSFILKHLAPQGCPSWSEYGVDYIRAYLKGLRPVPPAPCRDRKDWCTDWFAKSN